MSRPVPDSLRDALDHLRHIGSDNVYSIVIGAVFLPAAGEDPTQGRTMQCLAGPQDAVLDTITQLAVSLVLKDKKNFGKLVDRFFTELERETGITDEPPITSAVADAIASMRARCTPPAPP